MASGHAGRPDEIGFSVSIEVCRLHLTSITCWQLATLEETTAAEVPQSESVRVDRDDILPLIIVGVADQERARHERAVGDRWSKGPVAQARAHEDITVRVADHEIQFAIAI